MTVGEFIKCNFVGSPFLLLEIINDAAIRSCNRCFFDDYFDWIGNRTDVFTFFFWGKRTGGYHFPLSISFHSVARFFIDESREKPCQKKTIL